MPLDKLLNLYHQKKGTFLAHMEECCRIISTEAQPQSVSDVIRITHGCFPFLGGQHSQLLRETKAD